VGGSEYSCCKLLDCNMACVFVVVNMLQHVERTLDPHGHG
jgi:hypothetical protein